MRVDILTLFPEMFGGVFEHGITRRAREAGILDVHLHQLTDWSDGRYQRADDAPYGGGPGMVMRVEPLVRAVDAITAMDSAVPRVVLMSPRGISLGQQLVAELAREARVLLVAGRYEGVDERFLALAGAEEVSVGDYVLSGGEIPAMVVVEAMTRLLPGTLGDDASAVEDSFSNGLLEYPQYTRPAVWRGAEVPAVLRSGDHAAVRRYRLEQSAQLTRARRPDLYQKAVAAGVLPAARSAGSVRRRPGVSAEAQRKEEAS